MIVFLCSGYQGSIKKAVMKVAYDKGVDIVIWGSLLGSEAEPEGSFAEPLLRLVPEVCDQCLFFACGAFVCLLLNYIYLRCHT